MKKSINSLLYVRPRDSIGWGKFVLDLRPPESLGWGVRSFALVVLVVAYALVIPLKLRGFLPPTVSWLGVVLVPSLMFLSACAPLIFPLGTARQKRIMAAFAFFCCTAGMVVVYWQGWV